MQDFFVNEKAPAECRDSIPIVFAGDQPVWVVGYRIDERVRVNEHTKLVIRLELRRR